MEAFAIIGDAWRLVMQQPGRIFKACFILFVAPLALTALFGLIGAGEIMNTGLNAVALIFSSWLAVVFHRTVLINEDSGWGPRFYTKPILKYIGMIVITIIPIMVILLLGFFVIFSLGLEDYLSLLRSGMDTSSVAASEGPSTAMILLGLALLFVLFLVFLALSLWYSVVFPSVSVGTPVRFALRATRRKFWTFLVLGMICIVVLAIAAVVLGAAVSFVIGQMMAMGTGILVLGFALWAILGSIFKIMVHAIQAAIYARYVSPLMNTELTAEVFE